MTKEVYLQHFECGCKAVVYGTKLTHHGNFALLCDEHIKKASSYPYYLDANVPGFDDWTKANFKIYDFRLKAEVSYKEVVRSLEQDKERESMAVNAMLARECE